MSEGAPVAVDAMGGDDAPDVVVRGALVAFSRGVPVRLVGPRELLAPLVPAGGPPIVHAPHVIGMGEGAVAAVRRAEDSSVRVALREVREGRAGSVVACGHTGALVVAAKFDLGWVDGVDRPAIATVLPRGDGGRLVLLDAGANVDCRAEQLVTFAALGVAYAEALGVEEPRVGLLSNGEEESRGNAQVRAALPLLQATALRVVGPIEPTLAMAGGCDVLVTDGFVGNILLKAAEASVHTVVTMLREEVRRRPSGRLGAFLLKKAFARFRDRVAWDAQGGAMLLGVDGTVVVGHGRATEEAVCAAIMLAHRTAAAGLVDRVTAHMAAE